MHGGWWDRMKGTNLRIEEAQGLQRHRDRAHGLTQEGESRVTLWKELAMASKRHYLQPIYPQ